MVAVPRRKSQIETVIGKPPRYSLSQSSFPFKGLAALAGRSQLGGEREMIIGTLVVARLAWGAIGPDRLPLKGREARSNSVRSWLMGLAIPQGARGAFLRLAEASGTDDVEFIDRTLAHVIEVVDIFLDATARLELGRLVQKISAELSGDVLVRNTSGS